MFIKVKGECISCKKTSPHSNEYEACVECHFKYLAKLYLKDRKRWKELEALWDKQGGTCPYTGLQLEFGVDASLDHIIPVSRDETLANDITNMEFVHSQVNSMKRDMTKEEFLEFLAMIHGNLNLQKDPADWWK